MGGGSASAARAHPTLKDWVTVEHVSGLRFVSVAALAACACGGVAVASPRSEPAPAAGEAALAPEWSAMFDRSEGWTGADGAATIPLPGGETLWLFGDTWVGHIDGGRHRAGSTMVSNTIGVQSAGPTPAPIRFYWGPETSNGKPSAFIAPPEGDSDWLWPTGGGRVDPHSGELHLFVTRVARRGTDGGTWDFEARSSSLAVVADIDGDPRRWQPRVVDLAPARDAAGRAVIWGGALVEPAVPDGFVYVAGVDGSTPTRKRLLMARVPETSVPRFEAWRFWTGRDWSERADEAASIVDPVASEPSIVSVGQGRARRFLLVYADLGLGASVYARSASRPEGPWSAPVTLFEAPEPRSLPGTFVYAAKAHPELSRRDALLVSYCVNAHDFWDVAAHAERYRPRFIWVPVRALPP